MQKVFFKTISYWLIKLGLSPVEICIPKESEFQSLYLSDIANQDLEFYP